MTDVRENCRRILDKIQEAATRSGRDLASIKLIAVTKTVPPERIREALDCGIQHIGESRLQEALPKIEALSGRQVKTTYTDQARKGDHICYISDLTKFQTHYPQWHLTYTLDQILEELFEQMSDR